MEKGGEFGFAIWICLAANGAIQLSFEDLLLLLRSRIFSSSLLIQHPEHDGLWTASQNLRVIQLSIWEKEEESAKVRREVSGLCS